MSTSAAITNSLLRRAFGGQARPSQPRLTVSSMPRFLGALRARLATRLRDFATNRHESCRLAGLSVRVTIGLVRPTHSRS